MHLGQNSMIVTAQFHGMFPEEDVWADRREFMHCSITPPYWRRFTQQVFQDFSALLAEFSRFDLK